MPRHYLLPGLVLVILLLLVSGLTVELFSQVTKSRQDAALAAAVSELETHFFLGHRPQLEWIAAHSAIREFLAQPGQASEAVQTLLVNTQGLIGLQSVSLASREGKIRAASDANLVGANVSDRDSFRRAMSGLPSYSMSKGMGTREQDAPRAFFASVPVYQGGEIVGLVLFQTSISAWAEPPLTAPLLTILNPDGTVFASQDRRYRAGSPWPATVVGRVARKPVDVVPGFAVVSVAVHEWPWVLVLVVNVLALGVAATLGLLIRHLRLLRDRQRQVRERRQQELLLSHLMEGIAVFDAEGRLTWANPAFNRLLQRDGESEPPTVADLWDRPGTGPWRQVLNGERPWVVFESVLRGRQGAWIPVSAGFTAADGRFLLSILDGSERYRSDQLLRQSQKLTVLGQLSGGIAHDLNNMLGVLMGMADLLKMSLPEQDPLQESVELILVTLTRASGLSERMLNFARQTPINRVPFDMAALLRELKFLARTALPEGTRAEVEVADGPFMVEGDESLLMSAMLNLVLNAGEAMPKGGIVRLKGARRNEHFLVTVEDSGTGIDEATLPQIFEPFFSTKLDKRGTGLGLSLVRRTIHEHRGRIDVQSQLGVGTRVTVSLPLMPSTQTLAGS